MPAEHDKHHDLNPISGHTIHIEGDVSSDVNAAVDSSVKRQIVHVHDHYIRLGVQPPLNLASTDLPIFLRSNEVYRSSGNGANTWKYNYVLEPLNGVGIIINAAIVSEVPEEFNILINHEIRHAYIARILGLDVSKSSFPLREGVAGLPISATTRLKKVLERGEDVLVLPLSISQWDRNLDGKETNNRLYIDNPWYLGMFSFFHDYLCDELSFFPQIIATFKCITESKASLEEAWKQANPDLKSLSEMQQEWLWKNNLEQFLG